MNNLDKEKTHKGILIQTDKKNRNGRIYPNHIFMKELEKYDEKIKTKKSLGELGHPSSIDVSFKNVSHIVTKTYAKFPKVPRKMKKKMKKQGLYNRDTIFVNYKILDTESGKLAKQFINDLEPSPRGIGTIDENGVVNKDYHLLSIDLIRKETKA